VLVLPALLMRVTALGRGGAPALQAQTFPGVLFAGLV